VARDWSFAGLGLAELTLLPVLSGLCLWPGIQWYRRGMHWLPLGEAYAAMHLFYYVLPCLAGRPDWLAVSQPDRFLTLFGVTAFLAAFLAVYRMSLPKQGPTSQSMGIMRREVNVSIVWGMFGLWLVWNVIVQSGWLPGVGGLLNVFRSIATASGSMAVIFLFFQSGRRRLAPSARLFLVTGFVAGLAFSFASGFLNGGAEMMGAALLAFSLGRRQLPAPAILLCLTVLAVLQLGKGEYRAKYWAENTNYSSRPVGLVKGYTTWLTAAWHGLMRENQGNDEQQGFLERASLVQVLAHAMEVVPAQQPFLEGKTYAMLPELMVPRIFWPEKPRGTLPSETLGVYIGIQTEQGTDVTGIAVGQVAEGWINFGWFGFVLAGAFFGILFGLPAKWSRELAPNQAGWLLASIFLIYSINLENTIVEVLCSLFTALLMGIVLLLAISREIIIKPRFRRRTGSAAAAGPEGLAMPRESNTLPGANEPVGGSQ
jgi:hypothetical protein